MTWDNPLGLTEDRRNLVFLLSLSVILKCIIAYLSVTINPDGVIYISAAQEFASGHFKEGLAMYPMPLYSLLIALVHVVIPDWVAAAQVISIAASVLVLIPLYYLIKNLFNHKAAFWGCLAFVLTPYANEYAVSVIRGPAFLFCFAWAVYFCVRAVESEKWVFFLAAAFFAWLSFLFRIEGIALIPIYLLFLVCLCLWKSKERIHFIKGIIIWIAFPLIFMGILFVTLGHETISFNRISEVTQNIKSFFNLEFLDNYKKICEQLVSLEQYAPHPSGKFKFTEIARHFLPLIYFLGLLYSIAQVLFIIFIIPLYLGFKNSLRRKHVFILILFGGYVLMLYYTHIERDFIQERFLIAPAFLMYPWIGAGLARLFALAKGHSRSRILMSLFILAFIVAPLAKWGNQFRTEDNTLRQAGQWLASHNELYDARIITTDFRIPFFAGKSRDSYIRYPYGRHDGTAIEQVALARQMDCIIIRTSAKRTYKDPTLTHYKKIKEFLGEKKRVDIYCSQELYRAIKSEE